MPEDIRRVDEGRGGAEEHVRGGEWDQKPPGSRANQEGPGWM